MRRLAKQDREDTYKSKRDYQTLFSKKSQAVDAKAINHCESSRLVLVNRELTPLNNNYVAFGGFVFPSISTSIEVRLETDSLSVEQIFNLSAAWNRIGLIIQDSEAENVKVILKWDSSIKLSFWGLNANSANFPLEILQVSNFEQKIHESHLVPETFYFSHDIALVVEIDDDQSSDLTFIDGEDITLKKCSYCSRLLPLDMNRLGSVSFHKHNSKRTRHQNECRSCKKWRINNTFNPTRTVDQLHESSVITRERKLFLRDSEILQEIKKRTGEGLKSQVWERFNRKCFYCKKPLKLKEVHLDHTRPLAYLWAIDEHASCLCEEHNNQKKEKFPVDFYSDKQLRELSVLCGLSYDELRKKEINENELERILSDLPKFAKEWEPRTFAATARKIKEFRSDIDLYSLLQEESPDIYKTLIEQLNQRPLSVSSEEA